MLTDVLAPVLKRDPDELRDRLCIGSAEHCAELLSRYAAAGCQRVFLWPLGDEPSQIERLATSVRPLIGRRSHGQGKVARRGRSPATLSTPVLYRLITTDDADKEVGRCS